MASAALQLDPGRVLAARDAVLAAPEFQVERDPLARLLDWLLAQLEAVASFLPGALRLFAVLTLLLMVVGLIWWIARPVWLRRARGERQVVTPAAPGPRFESERAHALAALAEGRLGDCVRSAWLAALALLEERGVSRARVARSDWEHVAAGRRAQAAFEEPLAALATTFQRSHFGGLALERVDAEACLLQLARLSELAQVSAVGQVSNA
jgi:hypothetical protein